MKTENAEKLNQQSKSVKFGNWQTQPTDVLLTTLTLDFFTLSFLRYSIPSTLYFTFSESSNMDSRPRFFVAVYFQNTKNKSQYFQKTIAIIHKWKKKTKTKSAVQQLQQTNRKKKSFSEIASTLIQKSTTKEKLQRKMHIMHYAYIKNALVSNLKLTHLNVASVEQRHRCSH